MPEFFFYLDSSTSLCSVSIHWCGYNGRKAQFLLFITLGGWGIVLKQKSKGNIWIQ